MPILTGDVKKALIVCLSIILIGWSYIDNRLPVYDEELYLQHAYSLYKYNIFGQATSKHLDDEPESSARVAPLAPMVQSLAMRLNNDFAESVECHLWREDKATQCLNSFKFPRILQLIFFAFCMGYAWLLIKGIVKSELTASLTVIFILLSSAPFYFVNHFLTEPIYLPSAILFILCMVKGVIEQKSKYFILSSIFLGFATLARPSFYYLFFMMLIIFPWLFRFGPDKYTKKIIIKNFIIFSTIFFITVGGWLVRNYQLYEKAAITVGYGILPLTTRVTLNRMTNDEYIIGWIYYVPRIGNLVLRRALLGEGEYRKLDYLKYWFSERDKLRNEIQLKKGVSVYGEKPSEEIISPYWVIKEYVLGDIYRHIKLTFLLAWYGIFVQSLFGVFALPLVLWGLFKSSAYAQGSAFKIMCVPPFLMLLFNALLTASIPRYNLIFLLPMSFIYAVVFQMLIENLYSKTYVITNYFKK